MEQTAKAGIPTNGITRGSKMKTALRTKEGLTTHIGNLSQGMAQVVNSKGQLKQADELYRALVDQTLQGLVIIQDFKVVFSNVAFAEITGHSAEELQSLSIEELKGMVHPEDQALVWGRFQERLEGRPGANRYEFRGIRKDGTERWLEMITTRLNFGGSPAVLGAMVDITEQKRAEKALLESEERYRSIVENSHDGILIVDDEYRFVYVNEELCRILARSAKELIGQDFRSFLDEESRDVVATYYVKRQKGEEVPPRYEFNVVRKDGTMRRVEISSTVIRDSAGNVKTVAQILDVTERRQVEKLLRKERETFFSILQNAPYGVVLIDKDGVFQYTNPAFTQITGYTLEDVPTGREWLNKGFIDSSYKKEVIKYWHEDITKRGANKVLRVTCKDGEVRELDIKPTLIDDGRAIMMLADITERKRAEEALQGEKEKFRVLVEESPFGVSIVGKRGDYKYVNPMFVELFGYTLKDIPTGADWFRKAFPDPEYRDEVISSWMGDLKGARGGESGQRTFVVRCKDNSEKIIHFRPVTMDSGDQFIIYEDITERKQLEEQLRLAQKMEALGTLAGGIAHNFNNLLMGILGNTSLAVSETDPTHQLYEKLKNIERLVESGSKLTSQLLGYAREGRYEIAPLSLNKLVKETSDTFGITKKEIMVHLDLAENLLSIEADQGQIEQAMWNLYVNAADAMPGGGNLYLKTSNVTHKDMTGTLFKPRPGHYASVTVTDSGCGMSKKTIEHIFDPFFTTKGLGKGTGLGLASVYGIIKAHGGYIEVQSEKGRGTVFKIYLPASNKNALKEKQLAPGILRGTETILIVDDEDLIIQVGAEMLEKMGYKVLVAKSGKEAVDIVKANTDTVDLVVLDMIMPEMSGGETFDRLRRENPRMKVLLSSGYSRDGQATEILKRGCDGFIQKPFNMEKLSRRIREILDTA